MGAEPINPASDAERMMDRLPARTAIAPPRHGVAWRLLAAILLFSSMITMVLTAIQLYSNYRREVGVIERRLAELQTSYAGSLAGSLWHLDVDQIRLQLEGMLRLPDLQALELRETAATVAQPLIIAVGQPRPRPAIVHDYPLVYEDRGTRRLIGVLRIEAALDDVYDRLVDTALVILVNQGIKTFIVSLFILVIVYRMVTRHLVTVAGYLTDYDIRRPAPPLVLDRPPSHTADDLDRVIDAINATRGSLEAAYGELRAANVALEHDIHARRETETQLQQAVNQLTESNTELERFAYVAAHDLQEPLRSLSLFAQRLERRQAGRLDADSTEDLLTISQSARHMMALINDLLLFSRVAGKGQAFAPVAMNKPCAAALDQLAETIRETGAVVTVGPLPTVMADAVQMMQLWQHLIGNAVKFHRPGVPPQVEIAAECQGDHWEFSVRDNGIGIEATTHDVFEIFRRLHPQHHYPGTGVGLAICKRIVTRHKGRIWIDSPGTGAGTTVLFTLAASLEG